MPTRYRRLLAAAGLVMLAAGTWWMLASGSRGITTAVVLTFTAAALTLAVAAFGVPWQTAPGDRAELAAAARTLARDVGTREAAEQQKFLADTGHSQPANVGFIQPELLYWRTDGGQKQGTLADIATFYAGLRHGWARDPRRSRRRENGARQPATPRPDHSPPPCRPPPGTVLTVPVRLSLPSFDPGDGH